MAPSLYWAWRLTPSTVGVSSFQVGLLKPQYFTFSYDNLCSRSSYPDWQWHEGNTTYIIHYPVLSVLNKICPTYVSQIFQLAKVHENKFLWIQSKLRKKLEQNKFSSPQKISTFELHNQSLLLWHYNLYVYI